MSRNFSFYFLIVSAVLFVILVFMNFLGYWTADRFPQVIYFFCMVTALFGAGIEIGKKLNNRS